MTERAGPNDISLGETLGDPGRKDELYFAEKRIAELEAELTKAALVLSNLRGDLRNAEADWKKEKDLASHWFVEHTKLAEDGNERAEDAEAERDAALKVCQKLIFAAYDGKTAVYDCASIVNERNMKQAYEQAKALLSPREEKK